MKRDPQFWKDYEASYEMLLPHLKKIDLAELNRCYPVFDENFCISPLHPDHSEWGRYQKTYCHLDDLRKEAGRPLKVLDFGMQFGVQSLAFKLQGNELFAVDDFDFYGPSFDPLREFLRQHMTIKPVDALYEIPYEDEAFDVVTLLAVIEHLPDSPSKLMSEIRRVLKPGGTLIVDTPNSASIYKRIILLMRGYSYPPLAPYYQAEIPYTGHHREYNREELIQVLEWSDFDVEKVDVFLQKKLKIDSLFTLAQNIVMLFSENCRPYLWGTARKPS